ncbi:High-affinity nicotinic acid transporter [Sphaceloma murrayae]|uniref:High-affinity nicotinic acid transporter n=1 Tax=Sphaceloma murrayae TaxID=2082308 RepID=A0A2K1QUB6_9PEZI|nr:High-affinity nicotinic acid transporter [Sphaceloma murrayae]
MPPRGSDDEPASAGAPLLQDASKDDEASQELESPTDISLSDLRRDSALPQSPPLNKPFTTPLPSPGALSPALRSPLLRPPRPARKVSFQLFTPLEAAHVRRKIDTRLIPLLFTLYFLSFLDRSNIGNASLAGLRTDLSLSDGQFTALLRAFYVTYIAFEWMTLLYRVVPAHIYISCCVAAWGVVASLQALTTGFAGLLVLRLLLGVAEAAFGPGVPFYLSFFYKRDELAYRVGWFISAAPLASCVAGMLAWAILRAAEGSAMQGWRLLFLVEGFPSVIVAVWCWWWVPDGPGRVRWLKKRERRIAVQRLGREEDSMGKGGRKGLDWSQVRETLTDPKSYLTAGMFFSCNVAFSSMPVFEPVIVKSMGYTSTAAQGLSALPNLSAFVVVLFVSRLSDKQRSRSPYIMLVALCSMLGYIVLALSGSMDLSPILRYLCLFPITAGFFSAVTLTIVWTLDNHESDSGKGTGVALLNVIGQMGPLLGTGLYPQTDRPGYVKGHAVCAGFMGLVVVLAFALRKVLAYKNSRRTQAYDLVHEMKGYDAEHQGDVDLGGQSPNDNFT